jgi:hypothetical protein
MSYEQRRQEDDRILAVWNQVREESADTGTLKAIDYAVEMTRAKCGVEYGRVIDALESDARRRGVLL